jgi:hypothetical protein
MKEHRNHSLGKFVVYYLIIATAITVAISPDSSINNKKETLVILPNWGRYENPALPWSEDLYLDEDFTGFTTFEYSLPGGIFLGADWGNRMNKQAAWVVAEDTTATEVVNIYEKIVEGLQERGFYDYKIILLNPKNPSWRRLNIEKLENIDDKNLMIVGYSDTNPQIDPILEVGTRQIPNPTDKKTITFRKPEGAKTVMFRSKHTGWDNDIPMQPNPKDPNLLEIDISQFKLSKGTHEFKFFIDGQWEEGDNRELWVDNAGLLTIEDYLEEQTRYSKVLEKFKAPNAEAVKNWVDSHGDKKLSERWNLFNTKDLMKLALVSTGAWDPNKLPNKKSPQNNGLEYVHISKGYTPQAYFKNFHQSEFWNEMLIDNLATGKNLQELVPNAAEEEFARVLKSLPQQTRTELVYDPYLHLIARSRAIDRARRHYELDPATHEDPDGYAPNYIARELGYGLPKSYGSGRKGRGGNALESAAYVSLNPFNPPRPTGHKGLSEARNFLTAGFMLSKSGHRNHMVGNGIHNNQTRYGIGYVEAIRTLRKGNKTQPNSRVKYIVVITAPPSSTELPKLDAETIREFITLTPAQRKLRKKNAPDKKEPLTSAEIINNKNDEYNNFPATLSVNGKVFKNVSLKKEFPQSIFIKHDGGTTFINKNEIPEKIKEKLLGTTREATVGQ